MLTIKYVEFGTGLERIVEAEHFIAQRRDDGFTQFTAFDETLDDYKATWCGDQSRQTAGGADNRTIYVMNGHGSTVGVYHFSQPNFATGIQAEHDKIAA